MRKALNENPVVQIAVIGVMALLVAFLLFTRVLNQDSAGEEAAPATESSAAPTTPADTTAPPASATPPATESVAPSTGEAAPSTGTAPAPTAQPDVAAAFVPGRGLPEEVVVAYAHNKAVVLLIEKQKGIDDKAVRQSAAALRDRDDVEFIVVPAKDVSKYARITQGVDLNRVPALVVLRPRKLTDNVPEATVSYGFRGPDSVEQAVDDAFYDGKKVTYDP